MNHHPLTYVIFLFLPLALLARNVWVGYRDPLPPAPPPELRDDCRELVLLPLQFIAGLAGLCWCLIGLAAFLAPVGALAWLVLR